MARIRTIKPEFFTSLTVAGLPLEARLTFIGLWTHADEEGRCVDDTRLIRAALWPLDDRSFADVEKDLAQLADASLIVRYTVGGKRFLAVSGWREHQRINRPTKSKLPPPPRGPEEALTSKDGLFDEGSLNVHGALSEDSLEERKGKEQGKERKGVIAAASASATNRRTGTRIPADFAVTAEMVAWARTNAPNVDGRYETAQFIDYWTAKSGKDATKVEWTRTWQTWMRKAQKDAAGRAPRIGNGFQPFRNPTSPDAYDGYRNEPAGDPHAA